MSPSRGASLATLKRRAELLAAARAFFAARGVVEVDTPALSSAGVPDLELENVATAVHALGPAPQYLHTSPEYAMKRLLAAGSGDIYQLCRVFRDAELGRWHQPEFMLLEWYRAGWDEERLMDEVAALLGQLLGPVLGPGPARRLGYRQVFVEQLGLDPLADDAGRLEAALRARLDVPAGLDGNGLLDLAFSTLIAPRLERDALTFITDYPADQAALARLKPGTPPVAARFEVFAGGLELGNGFAELTDAEEQRRRFEAQLAERRRLGRPARPLDQAFLDALAGRETGRGLPECAGVAIGFDRVVALAVGAGSLAEAISFAHTRDSR